MWREALAAQERLLPQDDWRTHSTQVRLGQALLDAGKPGEAESPILEGLEGLERLGEARRIVGMEVFERLAELYESTGRPAMAEDARRRRRALAE